MVYDEDDVEATIARNLWRHHRLLPPHSAFRHNWDLVMIVFVIYNATYIPIELSFELAERKTLAHKVIDGMIDVVFACDIALNFRTAFLDQEYEIVTSARAIAIRYLRSWFVIDIFAVTPFEIFTGGGSESAGATGLLKLPRLLRLGRLLKRLDALASAHAFRIVHLILGFMLGAHWIACLWWAVGTAEHRHDVAERREEFDEPPSARTPSPYPTL